MAVMQELGETARNVFKDMSVTQRLAIVMTAVTVATALGLMIYIGSISQGEGTIPLPMTVRPQDYEEIEKILREAGVVPEYDRQQNVVSVPIDQRDQAYMLLASKDMFTDESFVGFEQMMTRIDYTVGEPQRRDMMLIAKQNELSRMIKTLDVIQDATVIFAGGDKKVLGPPIQPRAAVTLKTALGKQISQPIADTIISLVAGAMAGLDKRRVEISDQKGNHFYARPDDDPSQMASERLEQQRYMETLRQEKIERLVRSYIPGSEVFSFVTLDLDLDSHEWEIHDIREGQVQRKKTEKREASATKGPGAEVGTIPNTVRQTNTTGGSQEFSEESIKRSDLMMENGYEHHLHEKTPGKVEDMDVSVVIHLPPTYDLDGETGEPKRDSWGDYAMVGTDPLNDDELNTLRRAIARGVKHENWQRIEIRQVPWTLDYSSKQAREHWAVAIASVAQQHLTGLILALFAAVGLVMIWSQVRRAIPSEELSTLDEDISAPAGSFDSMTEADQANANFEQMRRRISDIVSEDPRKAASLVKRWMVME